MNLSRVILSMGSIVKMFNIDKNLNLQQNQQLIAKKFDIVDRKFELVHKQFGVSVDHIDVIKENDHLEITFPENIPQY